MALLAVEAAVVGVEAAAVERSGGRCRRERHDFQNIKDQGVAMWATNGFNNVIHYSRFDPLRASLVGIMGAGGVRDRGPYPT